MSGHKKRKKGPTDKEQLVHSNVSPDHVEEEEEISLPGSVSIELEPIGDTKDLPALLSDKQNRSPKKRRKNSKFETFTPGDQKLSIQLEDSVDASQQPKAPVARLDTDDLLDPATNGIFHRQQSESPSLKLMKQQKQTQNMQLLMSLSLHQLARDGDVQSIRKMLDMCTSLHQMHKRINQFDEYKLTPLHYAARCSHFSVVKLLVARGADVNLQGEDGNAPLHFAARYKRTKVGLYLKKIKREARGGLGRKTRSLDSGEQSGGLAATLVLPNDVSGSGALLRHGSDHSVQEAHDFHIETESIITFLLSKGADPNLADIYGMTPLHYAAMRENVIVAQELTKCTETLIDTKDSWSMIPLHVACAHGSKEVAKLLLDSGSDLSALDEQLGTPLHLAAQDGHFEIVKMLCDYALTQGGQDLLDKLLLQQDYEMNNPLMLAIDDGNFECVQYMLEHGADPNCYRLMHNTALHVAAVAGDQRIVEELMKRGAKIIARNADLATPLHRACAYNHWKIAEYLIRKGAEIEAADKDGFTPLLIAACEEHSETVACLLRHGGNVGAVEKLDKTAVYLAAEFNNIHTLQTILKNSSEALDLIDKPDRYMNTPLHVAAQSGYLPVLRCLLDNGALVDSKNEEEKTAIHLAAKHGRTRIVRELVRRSKLIVSDEDEDSNTPLHIAATEGHEMVVRELLEAGANIEARNNLLWTALDCAAAHGWERTTATLLDSDAPVDPVDKAKTTPLHLSCREGHVEVTRLLLRRGASIGLKDFQGKNCLVHAIERGHRDVAMVIVKDANWRDAMRNARILEETGFHTTPMRMLIKTMPLVAQELFNQCVSTQGQKEHLDYTIIFDYEFLDDTYNDWLTAGRSSTEDDTLSLVSVEQQKLKSGALFDDRGRLMPGRQPYTTVTEILKRNHPLNIMVESEREQLLGHPLVTSLLRHKWNTYGRYVYYSSLLLYSIFVFFLTGYVVLTPASYDQDTSANDSIQIFEKRCADAYNEGTKQEDFPWIAKFVIMALTILQIFKEFFQMAQRRSGYFSSENLIEWMVFVSSFLLVFDFSECTRATGLRYPWQWQMGAAAIFLAWINLVLFIRKFPRFGIYVVMFTDILRTFSRFFVVFFMFIIAFALGFYVLLQNQIPFHSVPSSLIKTAVMMIGEFEFDSLFNQNSDDPELQVRGAVRSSQVKDSYGENVQEKRLVAVHYKGVSYALFSIFVLVMTILIMNLLIGLAVDDIKAVQDKAVLKRLAMQVEMVLQVEQVLPEVIRRRWVRGKQKLKPNSSRFKNSFKQWLFGTPTQLSVVTICKALHREEDELEQLRRTQQCLGDEMKLVRRRVDEFQTQQQRLQSMVQALISHFEIKWEDQDEFVAEQ